MDIALIITMALWTINTNGQSETVNAQTIKIDIKTNQMTIMPGTREYNYITLTKHNNQKRIDITTPIFNNGFEL